MRPVAVIGIGKTPFGAFPDRDLRSLAVEAGEKCLRNGHAEPSQVEAFFLGNFAGPSFVGQNHLAPYISTALGIDGVPATRFEAACASSGSAFFTRCTAVAAGLRYRAGGGRGEDDFAAHAAGELRFWPGAGDCAGEMQGGRHLRLAVRHDRAAAHVRFRNHARTPGGGGREEPRQRREESATRTCARSSRWSRRWPASRSPIR